MTLKIFNYIDLSKFSNLYILDLITHGNVKILLPPKIEKLKLYAEVSKSKIDILNDNIIQVKDLNIRKNIFEKNKNILSYFDCIKICSYLSFIPKQYLKYIQKYDRLKYVKCFGDCNIYFPKLSRLSISNITRNIKYKNLEKLDITKNKSNINLNNLTNLKYLKLNNCKNDVNFNKLNIQKLVLNKSFFEHYYFQNIVQLEISNCYLQKRYKLNRKKCSKLEKLKIHKCKNLSAEFRKLDTLILDCAYKISNNIEVKNFGYKVLNKDKYLDLNLNIYYFITNIKNPKNYKNIKFKYLKIKNYKDIKFIDFIKY